MQSKHATDIHSSRTPAESAHLTHPSDISEQGPRRPCYMELILKSINKKGVSSSSSGLWKKQLRPDLCIGFIQRDLSVILSLNILNMQKKLQPCTGVTATRAWNESPAGSSSQVHRPLPSASGHGARSVPGPRPFLLLLLLPYCVTRVQSALMSTASDASLKFTCFLQLEK